MLRPLHQYVFLQTLDSEPGKEAKKRIPQGKVVAKSEQITDLKIDSIVIYTRNAGEFVNYHTRVYLLIDYKDILAVLTE